MDGRTVTWVSFTDRAAFDDYHLAACADHGIPHPGRNAETDEVDLAAEWTLAYVAPIDDHGTIKAHVPDADVELYGLTPTEPPIYYDETGEPVDDPPGPVDFDYLLAPGDRLKEQNR